MKGKSLKLSLLLIILACCPPSLWAQAITVTSTVLDEMNEPMIGASVKAKNAEAGVSTNIDGEFTLKADQGVTIVVSYVGYKPYEFKASTQPVTIKMEPASNALDEVVVVGVSMKKSDLTGSVSQIDGDALRERPVTTVNEALQGRVAGVSITAAQKPSDDSSIKIRGTNTYNSGSTPIYVVDGMVMSNDYSFFNSINTNDIESIQVLKDASATALYGSRGANGVVLITTKKGSSPEGQITFDGWIGIQKRASTPDRMTAQQLADLRLEAYTNGYAWTNPGISASDLTAYRETLYAGSRVFSDQEKAGYESGKSYDWTDYMVQTGLSENYNLSFQKAAGGTNIFLSMDYSHIKGMIVGTKQNKYSGRINVSSDIKPWLRVGTNTSYTRQIDNMPSDDVYNKALQANPLLDPEPYYNPETRYTWDYMTLYWRNHSEENNNDYNPFNSQEVIKDRTRSYLTSANYVNINPIKGLNIRSTFAYEYIAQAWYEYTPTQIQEAKRGNSGNNKAKNERWEYQNWQWDNTVSYDNTFAGVHRVNALIGTSASKNMSNYTMAEGSGFPSDDLTYHNLGASALNETIHKYIGSSFANNSLLSYVARANYSYDNRYHITMTGRYDGSSKFGPGHKWGFFPSVALGWDIANEKFMEQYRTWLYKLKLRAGYGVVGNQDIRSYAYDTIYYPQVSNEESNYAADGYRGNPDVTWEKQKQANIGLDLGFFNNRLRMSIDGFFIKNTDLLMQHNLANSTGYTYTVENIGDMNNNGFEITIDADIIATRDFTWTFGLNMSHDHNYITKLYSGKTEISNGTSRDGWVFLNKSIHGYYVYRCGGIANTWNEEQWSGVDYSGIGKSNPEYGDLFIKDLNGDGVIDPDNDREFVCTDPKLYGGFNTYLNWKGLSLNAIFTYSLGGKAFSGYYESLINSVGLGHASTDLLDRWTEDNVNAKYPRVITDAGTRTTDMATYNRIYPSDTDFTLDKTDFLRLSTLSLSYQFQPKICRMLGLSQLRVYTTLSNVFCWTSYRGVDPEVYDWNYPPSRQYTFGLSVTF